MKKKAPSLKYLTMVVVVQPEFLHTVEELERIEARLPVIDP